MKLIIIILMILIAVVIIAFAVLPAAIEKMANKVVPHGAYSLSREVLKKHNNLVIMDWHSDSLLGNRNLLKRSGYGHVDIPRLQEGNVALQMFMAVTKVPASQNYNANKGESNIITPLAILQLWPVSTWNSLTARAVYQAEKLHGFARDSDGQLIIVKNKHDLRNGLDLRKKAGKQGRKAPVLGLLGIEGLHALDGKLANIQTLYDAGYRMMGLHHFFDNKLGGSLHGVSHSGLTDFGKEVVRRLDALSVIIDLSHSSPAVVEDVLAISKRPVVISHTGFYGACRSERNISDQQMKQIAEKGGIIGIGYWEGAVCDINPAGIVKSIRYAIDTVGVDHVALGSDFDGATMVTFDTSELAVLTQEMVDAKFSDKEIAKIMGENSVRFLLNYLGS